MHLNGLLFFPVTPFSPDGTVDVAALAAHIDERVGDGAACVFAACGTGEFHALSAEEHRIVTETAVRAVAGRVPVFTGVGGSYASALAQASTASAAGASGILLMPPYLVTAPQSGLLQYVRDVARAADGIPVIVYQRGAMKFSPESVVILSTVPGVIGLKDGVGDISQMQLIVAAVRATGNIDFQFFNGLPTAELTMRAYRAIGVPLYSSAVFAFAPDIAMAFHTAFEASDDAEIEALLQGFFIPFVQLRDRRAGYQVALVKSATRVAGYGLGGVRPPLVDPTPQELDELSNLIAAARGRLALAPRMVG